MEIRSLRPLTGDGKKLYIETYGCQMNFGDSEIVTSILQDEGWRYTEQITEADAILLNTCSIRDNAEQRIWGRLREIDRYRKAKPSVVVGVIGCMAERLKEQLTEGEYAVDVVAGPDSYRDLPRLLAVAEAGGHGVNVELSKEETYAEIAPVRLDKNGVSAYIAIMRGCNNFCSYCIIPYARGNIRSKPKEEVIKEIKCLVNNGYKEVVLTGIHTGHYGKETYDYDFSDLLNELCKIDGLLRIRISSIEITELDDKFLNVLRNNTKIVDHIHIPLQSGCDKTLKAMNRKYDSNYYLNKINEIRNIRPNISITTDLIVGFPNETDSDFNNTYDFLKKINFSKIHVFPYSRRKGTPADLMDNQIDESIKKERVKRVMELSKELEINYMNKFINKELEILVEKCEYDIIFGHTSNYIGIKTKGSINDVNKIIRVTPNKIDYPIMKEE